MTRVLVNVLVQKQTDPNCGFSRDFFLGGLSTLAHSVRFSQIDLPRPSEEAFLVAQKLPLQKLGSQE